MQNTKQNETMETIESLGHWEDDGGQNVGNDYSWLPLTDSTSLQISPLKTVAVRTEDLADRYSFDEVMAMRFGIENGMQLLAHANADHFLPQFTEPLRLTYQEHNDPLIVI